MNTLHCTLENGADLCVNERQKILHYRVMSAEEGKRRRRRRRRKKKKKEEEECQVAILHRAVHISKIALYSDVIKSFDWKSAIEQDGAFLNV